MKYVVYEVHIFRNITFHNCFLLIEILFFSIWSNEILVEQLYIALFIETFIIKKYFLEIRYVEICMNSHII